MNLKTELISRVATEEEIRVMTFEAQAVTAFMQGVLQHEPDACFISVVARPAAHQPEPGNETAMIFNLIYSMHPMLAEIVLEGALQHLQQSNALRRAKPEGHG